MRNTKIFSPIKTNDTYLLPHLIEIQLNSYQWFIKQGLRELFDEISPIIDHSEKELFLSFGDYYFDEPKQDERKAKDHSISFEAPLRIKVSLDNKRSGEKKRARNIFRRFPYHD